MEKKSLIIAIVLLFSNVAEAKFRKCFYGGYNYTGTHFSDKYSPKQLNDLSACRDPLIQTEAKEINNGYSSNKAQINALAAEIINDSKCIGAKDVIKKYLDNRKTLEDLIEQNKNDRQDTFKTLEQQKNFDAQFDPSYGVAYSAACSSEDHRTFSILDLETINEFLSKKTTANKENLHSRANVPDCTNVHIYQNGKSTVKGLSETHTIDMINGTQNFLMSFDPYSIPDQLILTNAKNKILYDSGCKGLAGQFMVPIQLNLDAPQESFLTVKIISDCTGINKPPIWDFTLKCQTLDGTGPCAEKLKQLTELLKKEVTILKKILDHYELEFQCFVSYRATILENLTKNGFVGADTRGAMFGRCSILDTECEKNINEQWELDLKNQKQKIQATTTETVPEKEKEPELDKKIAPSSSAHCEPKPADDASIFEQISWTYCTVGRKRLGL